MTIERSKVALCVVAALAMGGCGGGGGGSKTEFLTLAGKVVSPGAAGADITVNVGAKPFVVKADGQGQYEIELTVEEALTDQLVTILAKLPGERAFVELLSRIGTFDEVKEAAGSDGALTPGEEIRLNVSSLSTAAAALSEKLPGLGKAFTFGDGVDPDEALRLAGAIELAIADPANFPLPEGSATTLALARDEQAANDFIEAIPAETLEQAVQSVVGNIDIVGLATNDQVPPELLAALLQVDGEYPYLNFNLVDGFEFDASGSGRYFNAFDETATSWSTDGSKIEVVFDPPLDTFSTSFVDCDGTGEPIPVDTVFTTEQIALARISEFAVSVTSRERRVSVPSCAAQPDQEFVFTVGKTIVSRSNTIPVAESEFSGREAAVSVRAQEQDELLSAIQTDVLSFNETGTGEGRYIVGSFDWIVDDGVLAIDYGNGVRVRLSKLLALDGAVQSFLADTEAQGKRLVDIVLVYERDPDFNFTVAAVPGVYFQFGLPGTSVNAGFSLRFEPAGSGAQGVDSIDGSGAVTLGEVGPDSEARFYWALESDGDLVARRGFVPETNVGGCDPRAQSNCVLYDERRVVPINKVGSRIYALNRRRFSDEPGTPYDNSARFYDYLPLPQAKSAMDDDSPAVTDNPRFARGDSRIVP